jgi:hypothetical protein
MWRMDLSLARRLVALAAAYAVVLNMLLPVLVPVLGATLPPGAIGELSLTVICATGGVGSASDRGAPEKPQPLCPCGVACAMPGCAAPVLPDDAPASAGAGVACVSVGLAGLELDARQREKLWPGGKLARGPPVA